MRAGLLRKRITIETPTKSTDAYGDEITAWATLKIVWGGIRYLSAAEARAFLAQEETNVTVVEWKIRYLSTVTEQMRVNWNSRVFDIRRIRTEQERSRKTILTCTETETA